MTIEYRQLQELEVRAEGDGRTIYGIVVPYGKEQRINANLTEVFMPGAFAQQTRAAHRVKLLVNHDLKMPIGRATLLREDSAGLYGEFRISDTNAGNEQLQLIEDGVIDASIAQKTALMSYLGTKLMYYKNHAPVPVVADNAAAGISPMPESVDTGTIVINKDNAKFFYHE